MEPRGAALSSAGLPIIRPISKGVVHRICAGQVILDLPSAVKELVENSLDAGATSIEIALKEYGKEWFQVIDNGSGISPRNFQVLALKHHTSKLADFSDLQSLTTFGFRGEALSSLCALGDLTVETRTLNEQVATHLTFDRFGSLIAEKKTARQIGTTVTVNKLFSTLPVRCKEFHRNVRKEYGKLISLLNAYALISKGVRLVCTNTTGRNMKSVVLKTQGGGTLKDKIIAVFGMDTFTCLESVDIFISDGCKVEGFLSKPGYGSGRYMGDRQFFFVNGRPSDMPKVNKLVNELYKAANSKQYPVAILNFTIPTVGCDVNVTPDKRKIFFSDEGSILQSLREALGKIYSSNHVSYSVNSFEELKMQEDSSENHMYNVILECSPKLVPPSSDCPNTGTQPAKQSVDRKTEGFNNIQRDVGSLLRRDFMLKVHSAKKDTGLSNRYDDDLSPNLNGMTGNQCSSSCSSSMKNKVDDSNSRGHSNVFQTPLTKYITASKRKHENIIETLSEVPILRNQPFCGEMKQDNLEVHSTLSRSPIRSHETGGSDELNNSEFGPSKCSRVDTVSTKMDCQPCSGINLNNKKKQEDAKIQKEDFVATDSLSVPSGEDVGPGSEEFSGGVNPLQSATPTLDSLPPSSRLKIGSTLQFSFQDLMIRRQQRMSGFPCTSYVCRRGKNERSYTDATLQHFQSINEDRKEEVLAAATTELERLFKKDDFGQMKVIGQFNLGFIIAKLNQDLFIVDQHAADEKYNYEHLCQSTILNQQPLLRPLNIDLSPEEEIVLSMHVDIIRKNGFTVEEDVHAPLGHRFKLKAVPFSKNLTFGVSDVKELISILADGQGECSMVGTYKMDTADSVCPPRIRAMLASRACRSAVMVGDSLGRNEMKKILEHLSGLKSPWNCPHGRPTMRHLVDLRTVHKRFDEDVSAL